MATMATLERVSAATLSKLILAQQAAETATTGSSEPPIAIIDVRDDDYIGGHIKGAKNVPSRTLDAMLPTLIRQLEDKDMVVFHCALSQQRGPSAALRYIRERERLQPKSDVSKEGGEKKPEQKVYVLDRGFVGWQEVYGTDERLTEGYRKELWDDYEG